MARIIYSILFSIICISAFSQSVGINESGALPNGKAILDISSTSKGLLIPRMTTAQRLSLNPSATEIGMMVYDISISTFCIYDGTEWDVIATQTSGGGGGDADNDWLNSLTDNNPNLNEAGIYHLGNVGIGHQFANYLLDIEGDTTRLLNVNLKSGNSNTGDVSAAYFQVQGNDDRNQSGAFSIIGGNGDNLKTGFNTQILNNGEGLHTGYNAFLNGTGTGRKFGFKSYIGGTGANERFGTQNHLDGFPTGNAKHFGVQNILNAIGGGTKYGVENTLYSEGSETMYGVFNNTTNEGAGASIGFKNNMTTNNADNVGQMIGLDNSIAGQNQGDKLGVSNFIEASGQSTTFGTFNRIIGSTDNGFIYGTFTKIEASGTGRQYGIYSSVEGPDDGNHYAGYFNAPGGSNDYAALFDEGNIVANESGGNYDFRIESENNASIFYVDGDQDYIGIGTFGPEKRMHVQSDEASTSVAMVENTSFDAAAEGLEIRLYNTSETNRFVVFKNGLMSTPIGSISGNTSGGVSYNVTSDARLKTKIKQFKNGLNTINKIRPYSYEMIAAPGVSQVGFLAQELYDIYPFAVSGTPNNPVENPMMVDYSKMTPLLLAAINEQQDLINRQDVAIETLEEKVKKLELLVNKLITPEQ